MVAGGARRVVNFVPERVTHGPQSLGSDIARRMLERCEQAGTSAERDRDLKRFPAARPPLGPAVV